MPKKIEDFKNSEDYNGEVILYKDDLEYIFQKINDKFKEDEIKLKDEKYEYDSIDDYLTNSPEQAKSISINCSSRGYLENKLYISINISENESRIYIDKDSYSREIYYDIRNFLQKKRKFILSKKLTNVIMIFCYIFILWSANHLFIGKKYDAVYDLLYVSFFTTIMVFFFPKIRKIPCRVLRNQREGEKSFFGKSQSEIFYDIFKMLIGPIIGIVITVIFYNLFGLKK